MREILSVRIHMLSYLAEIMEDVTNVSLFVYLGFYVTFNTVQVISRRVVGRAEETSTYSLSGFCTVNCRPTASNYQLSHLRPCWELNPRLRGGRRECYHSATVAPVTNVRWTSAKASIRQCFLDGEVWKIFFIFL